VVYKTCGRVECRNGMLDMCRSCVPPPPPYGARGWWGVVGWNAGGDS